MHIPFPFVYEQHSLANHTGKISCLLASLWATPPSASFPAVETLETEESSCVGSLQRLFVYEYSSGEDGEEL